MKITTKQALYDLLLTKYDKRIADGFLASIEDIRTQADINWLVSAIEANDAENAFNALHMQDEAFTPMVEEIRAGYLDSGEATTEGMPTVIRFSVRNVRAEKWLTEQSSDLIKDIVSDQKDLVRGVLADGMSRGDNPRQTALDLVGRVVGGKRQGGMIGLTAQQEGFARNARDELLSLDPHYFTRTLRDRRFDSLIAKAIETKTPIPASKVRAIVQRYKDRLLKWRGDMIGRTESLNALRAAKDEAFRQGIDKGAINPATVKRIWETAGDNRVRDSHEAMEGQTVSLNEAFTTPRGRKMMFPGDASLGAGPEEIIGCRCNVDYDVDFLAQIKPVTGVIQSPAQPEATNRNLTV
jgi:hypothetical protein